MRVARLVDSKGKIWSHTVVVKLPFVSYERIAASAAEVSDDDQLAEEQGAWYRPLFQFHIIISCLVVAALLCTMAGVGGVMLIEWLIEGL